ncbi:MAG: hypothetical protein R2932_48980 [Caldilineaceae bacterium]
MTLESTESRTLERWTAEDEIDLRQYFDILLRWWREIVGITVFIGILAVLAVLAMRLILPPQYIASAAVAIIRTTSDVNFDERFRTNSEELGTDTASLNARRNALLGLVLTGSVAQEVTAQLQDILPKTEQEPTTLLEMVDAEFVSTGGSRDSDLIRIQVTSDNPEKSAMIANAWASNYVRDVNTVYDQVPNEVLNSIQNETITAQKQYLNTQAALEAFTANSRIDELNSTVSVLQQRISQEVLLQQSYLAQWQATEEQLETGKALRNQIAEGGEGATRSSMVALQLLKTSAYGRPPADLQIELRDLPQVNQEEMLADLDGLLYSLEQRLTDLEAQIATGGTIFTPTGTTTSTVSSTLENLRTIKAQLEAENAKLRDLTQQRDLDWEAYKALSSKIAELNLTRAAASSEVRLGAQAVPPMEPTRRIALLTGIMVASPVGLLFALIIVFVLNYSGRQPFFTRNHSAQ